MALVRIGRALHVAAIVLRSGTVIALPKGHVEPGESAAEAALREVEEETGLRTDLVDDLGRIDYWFVADGVRIHKHVDFFLLSYRAGSPARHWDEVEGVRYLPVETADRELTYGGERTVARRAQQLAARLG